MTHTLVTFHAHPDDESIATGGVMAQAAAGGDRVVLVLATRGEHGEVADDVLVEEEELWQRRVEETQRAAEILGVARVEFLGYVDSGMMGEPTNHEPGSFWSTPVDDAAARLAVILEEEQADALTIYDDNGGYGHPDHIQVHRVGVRAAELAGVERVFESTINRDHILELMHDRIAEIQEHIDAPDPDNFDMGVPAEMITTTVDVRAFIDIKRAAMAAHASQIDEASFFLAMPPEAFREGFGYEWFMRRGAPSGTKETSLFEPA